MIERKSGCVTIIKGRPGCGKTNLALRDALYNVEIEKSVIIYVSLAASKERLVKQCKYAASRDVNIEEYANFVIKDDIYYDIDKLTNDIKESKPKTVYIDSLFLLNIGKMKLNFNLLERFIYLCKKLGDIALDLNVEIVALVLEHRAYEKSMDIVYNGPLGYNCIKEHINNKVIPLFMRKDGTIINVSNYDKFETNYEGLL
ncbi:MAG: hypothetical protein E7338_02770 [Clostridiales bacterium]|nr:hypothetical protein [Clostridiales bacterium]